MTIHYYYYYTYNHVRIFVLCIIPFLVGLYWWISYNTVVRTNAAITKTTTTSPSTTMNITLRNNKDARNSLLLLQQQQQVPTLPKRNKQTRLSTRTPPNNNNNNDRSSSSRQSSVAVCIRGDDRGVHNAYNLYKSIIEPLDNADIYIVIHTNPNRTKISKTSTTTRRFDTDSDTTTNATTTANKTVLLPLFVHELYKLRDEWDLPIHIRGIDTTTRTTDRIRTELLDGGMNITYWQQHHNEFLIKYNKSSNNALGPILDKGSSFFQFRDFISCHNLIQQHEYQRKIPYQHVVIVRSDQWCYGYPFCWKKMSLLQQQERANHQRNNDATVATVIPKISNPDVIYIPDGEDYKGINDRMIALPRQYATMFLTMPWNNIINNTNPQWYWYNTESVIYHTVQYIINRTSTIQKQQNDSTSKVRMIPTVRIERPYGLCFIACHIGKTPYSITPLYKYRWPFNTKWYLKSNYKLNYTQPGQSWSTCRSIYEARKKPYRGPLYTFASGVTGFKYSSEYKTVYTNSVRRHRINTC